MGVEMTSASSVLRPASVRLASKGHWSLGLGQRDRSPTGVIGDPPPGRHPQAGCGESPGRGREGVPPKSRGRLAQVLTSLPIWRSRPPPEQAIWFISAAPAL